jgi:predicted transcriptional regulator
MMTVTLELKPEIRERLLAQANALGLSVETYLASVIEDRLIEAENISDDSTTDEDWETLLQELAESRSFTQAPPLSDAAISRESIYSEREDSQL